MDFISLRLNTLYSITDIDQDNIPLSESLKILLNAVRCDV